MTSERERLADLSWINSEANEVAEEIGRLQEEGDQFGHSSIIADEIAELREDLARWERIAALLRASAPPADYDPTAQPYDEPLRHVERAPPADVAGRIEHLKYLLLTPRGRNGEVRLTAETVQGTIDALAALAGERDRLLSVMRRVQDCWNNYHGDLGSQKPGAEQYAREIQWPALLVAMEDFEGVLCNAEDTRAALGGSDTG